MRHTMKNLIRSADIVPPANELEAIEMAEDAMHGASMLLCEALIRTNYETGQTTREPIAEAIRKQIYTTDRIRNRLAKKRGEAVAKKLLPTPKGAGQ